MFGRSPCSEVIEEDRFFKKAKVAVKDSVLCQYMPLHGITAQNTL